MMTKDGPLWLVVLSVGSGAAIGALCRWVLSYKLNPIFASLPLGTLAANWLGAFLIGAAVGVFAALPSAPPALRLFLITGFLGGLTTFSTFSAEALSMLQSGAWSRAALHMTLHAGGSLALAALGIAAAGAVMKSV